jgi:BlaI family transcriptional regulator, penicillinase repressor
MLHSTPRPTDGELLILTVLWHRGPSTVRQVHEVLERDRPTGYTTVLKLLQIMHQKGLVLRDESERTHVYRGRVSEQQTQRQLVRDLVDRAFEGSAVRLVLEALALKRPTRQEAAEIRKALQRADEESPPPPPDSDLLF